MWIHTLHNLLSLMRYVMKTVKPIGKVFSYMSIVPIFFKIRDFKIRDFKIQDFGLSLPAIGSTARTVPPWLQYRLYMRKTYPGFWVGTCSGPKIYWWNMAWRIVLHCGGSYLGSFSLVRLPGLCDHSMCGSHMLVPLALTVVKLEHL